MTDIQKAVQAIRDTAEQEIKKLLAAEEEWIPDNNTLCVTGYGAVIHPSLGSVYNFHEMGNAYPTKELAEAAITRRKAYVKVTRLIAKLNREQGWVADWEDGQPFNYYIFRSINYTTFRVGMRDVCRSLPDDLYGSQKTIREVINNHGELYKVAMGWGE